MLTLKLNTTNKIQDGKILITDATGVYGSITYVEDVNNEGSYLSVTNTTGYGAPNAERSSLAFFLVAYLETSKGRSTVTPDVASHTASSWTVPVKDGVYSFYLIGVPIVANVTDILAGKAGFHVATNSIYKDGVTIAPSLLVGSEYSSVVEQQIYLFQAGEVFTELVAKRVELALTECSEKYLTACTKAIDEVEAFMYSSTYQFSKKNLIESVRIIESLNTKGYTHILKF